MFKKFSLLFIVSSSLLYGGVAIVPGDEQYYKAEKENVEIIFTEQNRYAAEQAMALEPMINREYKDSYGFEMDSLLHVGIISQQNQVANGFSTQYPYNLQINYIGGSAANDYFTSTSWLNTLLYHETAHNYQVNAKASAVTRGLYSVLGNGLMTAGYFPLFTLPNITISSYLLEGNAVLNESWHGNGGRLYSGRFRAETIMQAKTGNINPQFLYNQTTHDFPYYDRHYIIGGFFQLYLSEKYGLDKVNSFFYNHSKSWLWPFRINHIFEMTFGQSYEEEIAGYNLWLLEQAEGFVEAEGETLVTSKIFTSLNSNCDKVYFMIADAQRAPEVVRLFKKDKVLTKERESFFQNRLINEHDDYFTQASGFTDPTKIYMGLFDENGKIKKGTESKVIQGYLKGGVEVYFDIPSSFDQAQLFVGDTFYAQVNSSVYIDKDDNLYYFVQNDKTRTLYKNRIPIYEYEGYYGLVSGVDSKANVYFVANSQKGSTLYRIGNKKIERVSVADNVVEARLIDDEEVLIAAIGSEHYYYVINAIQSIEDRPYDTKLFFEDEPYFGRASFSVYSQEKIEEQNASLTFDDAYYGPLNLHYAGSLLSLGVGSKNNSTIFTYSVAASFIDPLLSNAFVLFAQSGLDEVGTAGLSYQNNTHLLAFGGTLYGVYNTGDDNSYHLYDEATNTYSKYSYNFPKESRDYGLSAYLQLPVIKSGYDRGDITLNYYQDYDDNARSPLSLNASLSHSERYGQSMFTNYINAVSLFGSYDREDLAYGFDYTLQHDLPGKFFIGVGLKGVYSDYDRNSSALSVRDYTRGVKFSNFQSSFANDSATVVMPSLEYTRFVKQVGAGELSIIKQFDARLLFFTFPLSLTREALYFKHRHYNVWDFGQSSSWSAHTMYNESTAGLTLELLVMNRLTVPINFEYIHNDNTQEEHNFRFSLSGLSF